MRARSAKQRFPVAQWKEDLGVMQNTAIKMSQKQLTKPTGRPHTMGGFGALTPAHESSGISPFWYSKRNIAATPALGPSAQSTRAPSPSDAEPGPLSMGSRVGPGHEGERHARSRKRLTKSRPESRDSSVQSHKGIRSIFPRSGRSSRATSPSREHDRGKQPIANSTTLAPSLPPISAVAGRQSRRVSRITEHLDEDQVESGDESQGDLRRFDFTSENPFDDAATTSSVYSVREDSETENGADDATVDEYVLTAEQVENEREKLRVANLRTKLEAHAGKNNGEGSSHLPFASSNLASGVTTPSMPGTPPRAEDSLMVAESDGSQTPTDQNPAPSGPYLSLRGVLQGKKDYNLQNVEPFFNDPTGLYTQAFEHKLQKMNGKNAETSLCIEEYLKQSEKDWFNRYRNVKLGKSAASSRASSIFRVERARPDESVVSIGSDNGTDEDAGQFLLQDDYTPPTGIKKFLLRRIGSWPLYTFLLALVSTSIPNT